jgi:hypothetical protein
MQQVYVDTSMLYVERIRETVSTRTAPGEIRNAAMSAVTPVKVDFRMPGAVKPGGKFEAKVVVTNQTNVPICASPVFVGAPGWVFKPKKASFVRDLPGQQAAAIEYWGIAPKDAAQATVKPSPSLMVRISNTSYKFTVVPVPEAQAEPAPASEPRPAE